jgi:tetratricopeptide (TPR) repeat protein
MKRWLHPDWQSRLLEQPEELVKQFSQSQNSDELYALAIALEHLGQGAESEKALKRALMRNLSHVPSIYTLGLRSLHKSKEKEAKTYLRRALRLDPAACETALGLLRDLKIHLSTLFQSNEMSVWLLKELEFLKKETDETSFHLGKLLFERSQYEESAHYLMKGIESEATSAEATEYLSYIYEHLYKGDELIEKILELAEQVPHRADLFFNMAMVCQHDQNRAEMALHFFYLASREDPADPGLKFSLEQAALDLINAGGAGEGEDRELSLMLAHLYQGSVGVAKRYAQGLKGWSFPESFQDRHPSRLWTEWLMKDQGVLGQALQTWFGGAPASYRVRQLPRI